MKSTAITGYHAHVYYAPNTRAIAETVREGLGAQFNVRLGRWHDRPIGPHPISMYQVAFAVDEFPRVVPWLMIHREGLDVLVHPETGDDVIDHTDHALWLGTKLDLNIDALRRG
jgi:aromatic ring-cleaving dioxygenase